MDLWVPGFVLGVPAEHGIGDPGYGPPPVVTGAISTDGQTWTLSATPGWVYVPPSGTLYVDSDFQHSRYWVSNAALPGMSGSLWTNAHGGSFVWGDVVDGVGLGSGPSSATIAAMNDALFAALNFTGQTLTTRIVGTTGASTNGSIGSQITDDWGTQDDGAGLGTYGVGTGNSTSVFAYNSTTSNSTPISVSTPAVIAACSIGSASITGSVNGGSVESTSAVAFDDTIVTFVLDISNSDTDTDAIMQRVTIMSAQSNLAVIST